MRVLVTGANGFVGAMLCRKLVEKGDSVTGLVRKTSDLSLLGNISIRRVVGSLEDPASLDRAVWGVEVVYHAAAAVSDWGTLRQFRRINVEGTRNLIEVSVKAGVRRFVYVSSVAVHSFIDASDLDESAPQFPTPFPYARSKRDAESLVMDYHNRGLIQTVIVRPGDVYGPGDRVTLLKMAPLLEKGIMGYIHGGQALGAFTYVENLADGLILAGVKPKAAGQAYLITDGIKLTWKDYLDKLTETLGVRRPWYSIHSHLAYGIAVVLESIYGVFRIPSRPLLTRYVVAHMAGDFHFRIDKAKRELGYRPRVDIDGMIRETAEWYKKVVR
jgi:nucleoside-diphosphate-sugar epimerase